MSQRNLLVRVGADITGLQRGMRQAQSQLDNFQRSVKGSVGKVGAMLAGIGAGMSLGSAIKDAMEYEALMGTISQTLGSSADDFKKWSDNVGNAMGISDLQGAKMMNNFSLRLKSIAKDEQDLFNKSTALMKASAVIRSKTGMEMTEISDRMRSAMNQEADGADELGVNVRVSAIEQSKAYKELANNAPWSDMNEDLKKSILYQHILDSVATNLGTTLADNTSIRMAQFTASLNDTKLALGQAFTPILFTVLPTLTKFVNKIATALKYVSAFMRALFGIKGDTASKQIDSQTKSVSNQTGAVKDLGKAIKDVGKARKKEASRGVAGFDQVHTLPSSDASSGGSGGSGGGVDSGDVFDGIAEGAQAAESAVEKVSEKIRAFADKVREFLKPMGDFFKKVWDEISTYFGEKVDGLIAFWKKYGDQIVQALKNAWDLAKPVVVWLIDFIWDSIKGLIDGVIQFFEGLIKFFTGVFTGDWKLAWEGICDMVAGAFKAIWNFFNLTLIGGLKKGLLTLAKNFGKSFGGIVTACKGAWNGILTWFGKLFGDIWKGITKPFTSAGAWFKLNVTDKIVGLFSSLKTSITTKAGETWTGIKNAFRYVYEWFTTKFDSIKTAFSNIRGGIITKAKEIWLGIASKFSNVYNWFTTKFDSIKTAFSNIKTAILNKAKEIWLGIASKFSNIYGWFTTKFGSITTAFSNIKTAILNKAKEIWLGIASKFSNVYSWFTTKFNSIKTAFSNIKTAIVNKAGDIWNGIKGKFTSVRDWFYNNVALKMFKPFADIQNSILGQAGSIWNGIKGKFSGAYDWFKKNVVNKMKDAFNGFSVNIGGGFKDSAKSIINNGIRLINNMIGGINSMLQSADNILPGNVFKHIPKIPYLAKGGIIDSPTVAMVGEAGKEAVMPLENNTGWITDLAGKIAQRGGSGGSGGGDIILNIDGRQFARVVKPHLDNESHRIGHNIRSRVY